MNQKICLFLDYLSLLSFESKSTILKRNEVRIIATPDEERFENSDFVYDEKRIFQYRNLIRDLRSVFSIDTPNILHAVLQLENRDYIQNIFKSRNIDFADFIQSRRENIDQIQQWALNSSNWFLIESENSSYELESKISTEFPVLIFDNLPLETSSIPEISISNIEDILKFTGLHQLWKKGIFGKHKDIVVLDTGISNVLSAKHGIFQDSILNLDGEDRDGHGSAMIEIILLLCPQANISSIKIIESSTTGEIWNFFAGLTKLLHHKNALINLSIGLNPSYLQGLGSSQASLKEATLNIINSSNANNNFHIAAAGNNSLPELRWPAAANNVLAVGSHNLLNELSQFSNYATNSKNFILTLGGDNEIQNMGKYGHNHSMSLYGTSVSTAITTGICGLLMDYGWFRDMPAESKISLFTSHCKKNTQSFPVLNIADIGAIWPL